MREQATLLAISHTLASTLELQPGLILDQVREIIEYDRAGLFAFEEPDTGQPGNARHTATGKIRAYPHSLGHP